MSRQSTIRLMHDVEGLSVEELDSIYGITIDADGSVWDSLEGKEFSSLFLWGNTPPVKKKPMTPFIKLAAVEGTTMINRGCRNKQVS